MDLSLLAEIAEWRDDSLRNSRNVTMPKKLSDEVAIGVRRETLKTPGLRNADRPDVYADKQHKNFQTVLMSIMALGTLWYNETLRDRIGNEVVEGPIERPFDVAVRLTKKLFDWCYVDGSLNRARIARGLFVHERLKVRTYGPQDWILTIRRLRQQAQTAELSLMKNYSAWDCLIAMCAETILDKPIELFDSCMPLCIEPDRVFQEDLAESKSVFETFEQQMDAFGRTFAAQQWTIGAMTKVWILALAEKLDAGWKMPVLKKQFGYSAPKNKKDTSTIFRNMLFNFGISWIVARDIVNNLIRKNFKMLESTVAENVFSHSLYGFFPKTIDAMIESKLLSRDIGLHLHKQALLLQGLMFRLHYHICTMKQMHLREKFVMSDFLIRRQTIFQPEHSKVFLQSHLNQTLPVVTSWTMLSQDQLGFDGVLGADNDDATDVAIKLLTSLTSDIASDLEILWHMMTHPDMWLKKKTNGGILLNRLPDSYTSDNKCSKLPCWMPSPDDWVEMRKTFDTSFEALQKMQIDAIAQSLE